jgi:hypothetical protein
MSQAPTGTELSSFASSIRYVSSHIQNLSGHPQEIDQYIANHGATRRINYDQHPSLLASFHKASSLVQNLVCLDHLPTNLNQLEFLLTSSDANSTSIGGLLASKVFTERSLRLLNNSSIKLPDNIRDLSIYLKELHFLYSNLSINREVLDICQERRILTVVNN